MMQLCTRKQLACNNASTTNKGRKTELCLIHLGVGTSLKTLDWFSLARSVGTLHLAGVHEDL